MFCGCWLPNLLFLLLCETLLSNDFPARSLKDPFYFRKFKITTEAFSVVKRKINQCVYLASLRLKLSSFHWRKILFFHQIPIPRFTKTFFTAVSELCKDTPGAHCTISWEKKSGESVLWVLTAIPCGTLIRWKYTVRWLYARSGKKSVMSRKLKNLTKTVVMKIKMNQCVFLTGMRLQLSSFPRWKMLLLLQGPNSHVHKVYLQAVSELCKDTPRTQGTILSEKISAEGVP